MLLPFLIAISAIGLETAHAQMAGTSKVPINPNSANQDLQNQQQIQQLDEQRRRDALSHLQGSDHDKAVAQAQIAKFLDAINPRKRRFADFDQVVFHGNSPVSPAMLGQMARSPYAADIAYYLGKHPDQSGAIAKMQPAEADAAVQQLAATIAAESADKK